MSELDRDRTFYCLIFLTVSGPEFPIRNNQPWLLDFAPALSLELAAAAFHHFVLNPCEFSWLTDSLINYISDFVPSIFLAHSDSD